MLHWDSRELEGKSASAWGLTPERFANIEVLSLACTQTSLPATAQRKLVDAWCELLPRLKLKSLHFTTKATQSMLDAAARIEGLEHLHVKWSGARSAESLAHCGSLVRLEVGSSPSLCGLATLQRLENLKCLRLENIREARDLGFVRGLPALEELSVSGSMWTDQHVDDLWPLQELRELRTLYLIGTRIGRDGLTPLHALPRLETLMASFYFRASEFAALRAAVPTLKHGSPFESDLIAQYCKP